MAIPHAELQKVNPSAVIELYELQLKQDLHGDTALYRFHAGVNELSAGADVVWNGNTYQRFPVEASGFDLTGNGQLPRPRLRISNALGTVNNSQQTTFSQILLTVNAVTPNNDLGGATFTRIRTMARFLDSANFSSTNPDADATAEWPRQVFFVDRKVFEDRETIEWELASVFDLAGVRAPKRQCISAICQWVYKDPETCGYSGTTYLDENDQTTTAALDQCGKRLSSCRARFPDQALPFGSFPGVGTYSQ